MHHVDHTFFLKHQMAEWLAFHFYWIFPITGVLVLAAYFIYRRMFSIAPSAGYALATVVVAGAFGRWRHYQLRMRIVDEMLRSRAPEPSFDQQYGRLLLATLAFAAAMLIVPCAVYLYQKWMNGRLSDNEKKLGLKGWVAWLNPYHLVWSAAIAGTVAWAYDVSFLGVLIVVIIAFAAYPLVGAFKVLFMEEAAGQEPDDLAADRNRVLKMLEDGKISAEESAELLTALGQSHQISRSKPHPLTPGRKLLLAGAALVLAGFFLPWFQVDLAQEMNRATEEMSGIFPEVFAQGMNQAMAKSLSGNTGQASPSSAIVTLSGGDIQRGMGWAILLFALGVAAIPFQDIRMEPTASRAVAMAALGIGSLFLLYLLTSNLRYAAVGLVPTVVGYLALWAGALRRGVFES